jgi:hypothetical protein
LAHGLFKNDNEMERGLLVRVNPIFPARNARTRRPRSILESVVGLGEKGFSSPQQEWEAFAGHISQPSLHSTPPPVRMAPRTVDVVDLPMPFASVVWALQQSIRQRANE